MERLFEEAAAAISLKGEILAKCTSKQEPYYKLYGWWETKKIKFFSGLKWIWDTKEVWREELRFQPRAFYKDLQDIESKISTIMENIAEGLLALEQEIERVHGQRITNTQAILETRENLSIYLEQAIILREKLQEVASFAGISLLHLGKLKALKHSSDLQLAEFNKIFVTISAQQRAHLLLKHYAREDLLSKEIIKYVKEVGFDPIYSLKDGYNLVRLAIDAKDLELFQLILTQNPTVVEDDAALRYTLEKDSPAILKFILSLKTNFSNILPSLIRENDLHALEKIFADKPSLIAVKIKDKSLIHYAVESGNFEIIRILCDLDIFAVNKLDSAGNSPLTLALKNNQIAIASLLLERGSNTLSELKRLIMQDEPELIEKLIQLKPALINEHILYQALDKDSLKTATWMLTRGENCDKSIAMIMEKQNIKAMRNLESLLEVREEAPESLVEQSTEVVASDHVIPSLGEEGIS